MLPVRDDIPSKSFPVVNLGLIFLNSAVFWHELMLGRRLEPYLLSHGLVPAHPSLDGLLTSMFLHGGWLHVIGNMWFLWIFGDNVEDRLGHFRYLGFYLLCGVAAALVQIVSAPHSRLPMIGASGAIAGVLGAYFLYFPKARVTTLVPIFIIPYFVELPAFLFLGVWFLMQLLAGRLTLGASFGGVAVWAHIGGFVAGMFFGWRWGGRKGR